MKLALMLVFPAALFGQTLKCDGVADDTAAIQSAIDAAGQGTLEIPARQCMISSPGLYLYPGNSGITIRQMGNTAYGNNPAAPMGLFASAKAAPAVVLTIYAQNAKLDNLRIDCGRVAAHGLVNVMGLASRWNDVTVANCTGDGAEGDQHATPATAITFGGKAGTNTATVAAVTQNRLTLGAAPYCRQVIFGYGTANAEQHAATRAGSVLTIEGKFAHDQRTAQCSGNTNDSRVDHFSAFNNGGWGWHLLPGADNNAWWWMNPHMAGNALGGELWNGSKHKHYGGDYEGDAGPAIQLGEVPNTQGTHFMKIGPVGDLEEASPAFNTVSAVCDDSSSVEFTAISELTFPTGKSACATYPAGSTTTGFGTDSSQCFRVKTAAGVSKTGPGCPVALPGNVFLSQGPNYVSDQAGAGCANNALCATLADANGGTAWAQMPGLQITLHLAKYSLQGSGTNTLTLNGVKKAIAVTSDYAAGSTLLLTLDEAGHWRELGGGGCSIRTAMGTACANSGCTSTVPVVTSASLNCEKK